MFFQTLSDFKFRIIFGKELMLRNNDMNIMELFVSHGFPNGKVIKLFRRQKIIQHFYKIEKPK